jgi:uncharacterized BrkB/YihY/UPF0761 family membrane protein
MFDTIHFFKAWILYFVIWLFMSLIFGLLIGFLGGIVLAVMGIDPAILQQNPQIANLMGLVISMVASFFVFKWAVLEYILPQIEDREWTQSDE